MKFADVVFQGNVDDAKTWIAANPNLINEADSNGSTPLSLAIEAESPDIVRLLLECGASPNERGSAIMPSLHQAIDYATEAFKDGPPGADGLATQTVKLLLDFGADIHTVDQWGRTALEVAEGRHLASYNLLQERLIQH
ncbi:MAG: hypothetical protein LBK42_03770 [Propionibacteriaceae bacterium]|jgi:ankyrin repeat protein|nr:hypothetical protein [Propionibacteriaceae bacterium]